MALLDPVHDNAALAALMVALYGGFAAAAHPIVHGDGEFVTNTALFYLGTAGLAGLYLGYRAYRGRTYDLWGNVTYAVLAVSGFHLIAGLGPSRFSGDLDVLPWPYFLVTGLPIVVYLCHRGARAFKRSRKRNAADAVEY